MDRRDLFKTTSTRTVRRAPRAAGLWRPEAPGGESARGRSRSRRSGRRYLVLLLVVFCVLGVVLPAADRALTAGEIHAGVQVGTAVLGGKTLAGAREILETGPAVSVKEIEVAGPEGVRFTARELGVSLDVEKTLDQAYAVGRGESSLGRLRERLRAALVGKSLTPDIDYDLTAARSRLEEIAAGVEQETREATARVEGDELEVEEAVVGRSVDVRATVENVVRAAREGRGEALVAVEESQPQVTTSEAEAAKIRFEEAVSGPVVLFSGGEEWTLPADEVGGMLKVARRNGGIEVSLDEAQVREGLSEVYEQLDEEPAEAGYVAKGGELSVTQSRTGRTVQQEELMRRLDAGLFSGERRFEVPIATSEPGLTTEEAEAQKPTTLLGRYRTNYLSYDDNPGRVDNLRIASDAVNGTTLAPGEVFSFNKLAEPLDYYETKVIIDGQVDYADGGGLCQVASTLYMAANYAGLRTVERHPHYAELPYIQPGFDATVWFGSLDLRLKNNTDNPLLFLQWVDDNGYVNAQVWGRPTGKQVEMSSSLVSTTLDADGNPVTNWVTYREVTKDGEVVSDGPVSTDSYGYLMP